MTPRNIKMMDSWTRSRMTLNEPNTVSQQDVTCSIHVANPEREIVEQPEPCMNAANECEQFISSDNDSKYGITQPPTVTISIANENEPMDLCEEKPFTAEVSSSAQLHTANQVDFGELEDGCNERVVPVELRDCTPKRMEVERQSVKAVLLQAFRKCTFCDFPNIAEKIIYMTWQTMEFCSVECLCRYQIQHGSFCHSCHSLVTFQSMGKCALRIGFEIRQFCSSLCVAKFKKTIKLCGHCQIDLTNKGSFVRIPPAVGVNVQEYCSKSCANNCKLISSGSKMPQPNVNDLCTVCNEKKQVEIQVIRHSQLISLCSDVCFKIFRYANSMEEICRCFVCKKFFPPSLPESSFCCCEGMLLYFCGKICHNIFLFATRKTVSCLWCKVKKYNYDMIKETSAFSDFSDGCVTVCSINCLNLYQNSSRASSKRNITANILSESLASMEKVVLPSAFPASEVKSGIPSTACSTATKKTPVNVKLMPKKKDIENNQNKCIEKIIMKPSGPKNCADKLKQCKPSTNEGECLTVLPIPDLNVPSTGPMCSIPIPVPIPVTQLYPVPALIPIPEKTYQNIMFEKKITTADSNNCSDTMDVNDVEYINISSGSDKDTDIHLAKDTSIKSSLFSQGTSWKEPGMKPKDRKALTNDRKREIRKELVQIYRKKRPERQITDLRGLTSDEKRELMEEYVRIHRKKRGTQNHVVELKAESPNTIERRETRTSDESEKVSCRKKHNSSIQVMRDPEKKRETKNPVVESDAKSAFISIKRGALKGFSLSTSNVGLNEKEEELDVGVSKIIEDEEKVEKLKRLENMNNWFYRDQHDVVQGPFSSSEMADWFTLGYFHDKTLMVRRANECNYYSLQELVSVYAQNPFENVTLQNIDRNETLDRIPIKDDPGTSLYDLHPGNKRSAEEPEVTYNNVSNNIFKSSEAAVNIPNQRQPRPWLSSTNSGGKDQFQSRSSSTDRTDETEARSLRVSRPVYRPTSNVDYKPSRRPGIRSCFPWQPPTRHYGSFERPTGSARVIEELRHIDNDIIIKARLNSEDRRASMIHISVTTPTNLIGVQAADWALHPEYKNFNVCQRQASFVLDHASFTAANINCEVWFSLFPFLDNDHFPIKIRAYEVPSGHMPAFSIRRVQLGEPFIRNRVVSLDLNHQVILIRDDEGNDFWFKYEIWAKSRDPSRDVSWRR